MRAVGLSRRSVGLTAALGLLFLGSAFIVTPAQAASCPPASVGGPAIGAIEVAGTSVPLKFVTYPLGGVLRPPATNQAAGVSTLNAPLDATEGTSVLTWHVRYGPGCPGRLNGLLRLPVGGTFTISSLTTPPTEYRITRRLEVAKGNYRKEWFSPVGKRRVALFTCGDLRYERFHSTIAIFAEPVSKG